MMHTLGPPQGAPGAEPQFRGATASAGEWAGGERLQVSASMPAAPASGQVQPSCFPPPEALLLLKITLNRWGN